MVPLTADHTLQPARLAAQVRADTQLADMTLWRAVRIGIEAAMQVCFKARRSAGGPAARRRRTGCPHFCFFAARRVLDAASCLLHCPSNVARCWLHLVCCMLHGVCCMVHVVCCKPHAACCVRSHFCNSQHRGGRQWTIKLIDLHRMPNLDEALAKAERTSLSDRFGPVPHTCGAVQNRK